MVSSLSNNIQKFIDIKMLKNGGFHHNEHLQTRKIMKMMLYLREHLKYVRAQRTSLLTCDKAATMIFTMVLALPQEQDCDVVGEPQVLTAK